MHVLSENAIRQAFEHGTLNAKLCLSSITMNAKKKVGSGKWEK